MLNVFEQPWTLVGAAVLVLFGVLTVRSVIPEKRRPWQWLLPAAVAGLGFGLDSLVQTDAEQILAVIRTGMEAMKAADCRAISAIIADDYADPVNTSKPALMQHCETKLAKPIVQKARITGSLVELSPPQAKATIFAKITFTEDSYVAQSYKAWILLKARIRFKKQPSGSWLITRIDILEVDKQPFDWRGV